MNTALRPIAGAGLQAGCEATLAQIEIAHQALLQVPDVAIATEHLLHGGMYVRTIRLKEGVVSIGSRIKRPTVVIINGPCSVLGDAGWIRFEGYNVIAGSAGRKMLRVTRGYCELTAIVATQAKTIREAEDELYYQADQLLSRQDDSNDTITITGE